MGQDDQIRSSANTVQTDATAGAGRIKLVGEIDHAAVERFDQAVRDLLDDGADRIVVDFDDLSFFDSACLSALVRARTQAEEHGGTITLTNVDRFARRILDLTGLSVAFAIEPKHEDD
jgi:stage II sporulation protein AA (anti-sigma F factor antagonist)